MTVSRCGFRISQWNTNFLEFNKITQKIIHLFHFFISLLSSIFHKICFMFKPGGASVDQRSEFFTDITENFCFAHRHQRKRWKQKFTNFFFYNYLFIYRDFSLQKNNLYDLFAKNNILKSNSLIWLGRLT